MKHKQYLLRFALPDGIRMYPNALREALARSNALPPAFFGYDAETGHPLRCREKTKDGASLAGTLAQAINPQAFQPIRIVGGKSWVGVLADEATRPLLEQAIAPALSAVVAHCRKPVPVNIEEIPLAFASTETPVLYRVREMAIKKGLSKQSSVETQMDVIKARIESSLQKQADFYGFDCPPPELLEVRVADITKTRGLQIVGQDGPTRQFAALVDLAFFANARLKGQWVVGNMTSRGYGRVVLGDYTKPANQRGAE